MIRKHRIHIVLVLMSIFSFQLGASCTKFMQDESCTYMITDVEDNGQQGEDSKSEVKLKEYDLNKLALLERKMNLAYSIEHAHFSVFISSKIFLDIVTPPPRA